MIRLTVISNSMPYQVGIVETSKWSRTSGGIRPTFSKMVKFGPFYGRLDASESYARAWESMTGSARLECLEGLVPKQWEVEPSEEAGRFFSRFFKQAPSEIGGEEDESPKPVAKPAEWTCSKCGAKNSGKFCPKCGTAAPKPEPPKPRWKCECGATNIAESKFCENCGKGKPEPQVESKKLSEMTVDELFEILAAKDAADAAAAAKAAAAKAPTEPIDVPQEDQKPVGDGQNRGSDGKFTKKDKK